ncbi:MAG: hypothetical protein N2485_08410, partial [bacterium]|nr:hypothetical protein [bacterium]
MNDITNMIKGLFKKGNIDTVQNYIPIDYIKDGIIKIKHSNNYRVIIKITPINFFTKTEEEKDAHIRAYLSAINSLT